MSLTQTLKTHQTTQKLICLSRQLEIKIAHCSWEIFVTMSHTLSPPSRDSAFTHNPISLQPSRWHTAFSHTQPLSHPASLSHSASLTPGLSLTLSLSHVATRMPQGWDRRLGLICDLIGVGFDGVGLICDLWFVVVGLFCGVLWVCFMVAVVSLVVAVLCWCWLYCVGVGFCFFFFCSTTINLYN